MVRFHPKAKHLGYKKSRGNSGINMINYQPQLVLAGFLKHQLGMFSLNQRVNEATGWLLTCFCRS